MMSILPKDTPPAMIVKLWALVRSPLLTTAISAFRLHASNYSFSIFHFSFDGTLFPQSRAALRVLQLRDLPHPIPRAWFSFLAFSLTNPINPLHPCESFPLPHLQSLTTFALILTPSSPPHPPSPIPHYFGPPSAFAAPKPCFILHNS